MSSNLKFILVSSACLAAFVTWISREFWNWEWHRLPNSIAIERVLVSSSEDGSREGCWSAVYAIAATTIARLEAEGIKHLREGPAPVTNNPKNPFGEWTETPGTLNLDGYKRGREPTYVLNAMGGCQTGTMTYKEREKFRSEDLRKALSEPGSFSTVTENLEGLIVVVPKLRLAAYFYYG